MVLFVATSIALSPLTASAWGPIAQRSIVATAAHVLSRQHEIRLTKLESYIREGAEAPKAVIEKLYPNVDVNAVGTIEREIYLLQTVRGNRVDPYYAYRLGTLGQLVAQTCSPMESAGQSVREEYFRDVDRYIRRVQMQTSDRLLVDPQAYFLRVRQDASNQDDTIEVDYRSGLGFDGLAGAMLSEDASRAVDAVADVWYTIFAQDVEHINVSQTDVRDFSLQGLEYYLAHNKLREADEMYAKVASLGMMTPDLRKNIGDVYFDTGHFDNAIEQYRSVLEAEPGRRDVVVRISGYFEVLGDTALAKNRLEDARDAFASALEADALNPDALRKLQNAESKIASRDERLPTR